MSAAPPAPPVPRPSGAPVLTSSSHVTELDLIPGIGTFVLCLTLPLEMGILTGVVVNIIFILYHAARPKFSVEMLKVSVRPGGG